MVFLLAVLAGAVAGLVFDVFVLCLLLAPFSILAALAQGKAGVLIALATGLGTAGAMQIGFVVGLLLRATRLARAHLGPARSSKAGEP